jgi:hypothetical protein
MKSSKTIRCSAYRVPDKPVQFLAKVKLRSSALKKSVVAGERERPDVARRRAQWTKYQGRVAPERLVFIDGVLQRRTERRKMTWR